MKQTQTKLFDFSDVDLDFCAGSKNLFPVAFRKIFVLGYNTQTVSSVAVSGNQVTLTYGMSHGYVADRVLKISSGALAAINGGEFVIDSVTTNTVTMTIDDAPLSVASGFTTRIAPLGWELVYESGFIQIFKFKDLDGSDLYLRLAHQNAPNHRNTIMPCIGRTVDLAAGTITDENSYANGKKGNNSAQAMPKWEFTANWSATYNTYTYSQGLSVFGKGVVVGSPYHLLVMSSTDTYQSIHTVMNGFVPCYMLNYNTLKLPLLFTYNTNASGNDIRSEYYGGLFSGYVGNVRVIFLQSSMSGGNPFNAPQALNSFIGQDNFNTTAAEPIAIYEYSTKQFLGFVTGGMYIAKYATANQPDMARTTAPKLTYDIDLNSKVNLHAIGMYQSGLTTVICIPVEEIKIVS